MPGYDYTCPPRRPHKYGHKHKMYCSATFIATLVYIAIVCAWLWYSCNPLHVKFPPKKQVHCNQWGKHPVEKQCYSHGPQKRYGHDCRCECEYYQSGYGAQALGFTQPKSKAQNFQTETAAVTTQNGSEPKPEKQYPSNYPHRCWCDCSWSSSHDGYESSGHIDGSTETGFLPKAEIGSRTTAGKDTGKKAAEKPAGKTKPSSAAMRASQSEDDEDEM